MPDTAIVMNLAQWNPRKISALRTHGVIDPANDWCVLAFTEGPSVGNAPAVLHIKYDDGNPKPPGDELLLSTYWTKNFYPPNPQKDDFLKKYARTPVRMETRRRSDSIPTKEELEDVESGAWKLMKDYGAAGMSGSPFVETTGNRNYIRAILSSQVHGKFRHSNSICRINQHDFDFITTQINGHVTLPTHAGPGGPEMGVHRDGRAGYSSAHHFAGDILSPYSVDKDSEENSYGYGLDYDYHNSMLYMLYMFIICTP